MKTLCLGGSFNPIHHGHLICARAAAEAGGYDCVKLIPSAQPPHKTPQGLASPEDRVAMCQLAADESGGLFAVSSIELQRSGKSFTIDTVRALRAGGERSVHWLIGADALMQLHTWHQFDALIKETEFVIMQRPGNVIDWDRLPPAVAALRHRVLDTPLIDIRASDIRRRVQSRQSIEYLTPPPVVRYIDKKGLYR